YNTLRKEIEGKVSNLDNKISRQLQLISKKESTQGEGSKTTQAGASGDTFKATLEFADLRARVKEKDDEVKKLTKQVTQYKDYVARIESGEARTEMKAELGDKAKEFEVLKVLIERYADFINKKEAKTVGEIRAMIDPSNLTIQSMIKRFKEGLQSYAFEADYLVVAQRAFEYVQKDIVNIKRSIDISFWMYPEDVIKTKSGDNEDQAMFLCSILRALGDPAAYIRVVKLDNGSTHSIVMTKLKEKDLLLDTTADHKFEQFLGDESDLLIAYNYKGSKIANFLYKFNDKFYEEEDSA
ncbi:MAG: transglutaminase domain-containing protein, partial [Candidatus Diapherotrites archaeon]|nr:transglutaminase domain-containing protein [Candidatus Diapherotrites archaeon]